MQQQQIKVVNLWNETEEGNFPEGTGRLAGNDLKVVVATEIATKGHRLQSLLIF